MSVRPEEHFSFLVSLGLDDDAKHKLEIERAIPPDISAARGVAVVRDGVDLALLGLAPAPTPGIVFQIHPPGKAPERPIYVYRPNVPADPKRKYLWPSGVKTRLDVNPQMMSLILNPEVPKYITEGALKGDALAARVFATIAIPGVWNWGAKAEPGIPVFDDWEAVPINGSVFKSLFDSDQGSKPQVKKALWRLTRFLESRGGIVFWGRIPDAEDGSKQGIDDYFAAGGLLNDIVFELPDPDPIVSAPLNDRGNAERLEYWTGRTCRWIKQRTCWMIHGPEGWDASPTAPIRGKAMELIGVVEDTAAQLPPTVNAQGNPVPHPLVAHALKSGNAPRMDGLATFARDLMAIDLDELDADPWLFGVANGIVDLRTGALMERDPDLLVTMASGVAYDPGAQCPEFEKFFRDILDDRDEVVDWVHRFIGYALTGFTDEQIFALWTGVGGNGKGVLVRILTELFGSYATNLSGAALHKGRNSAQGFDLAELPGKRLATSTETTTADNLDEQRLKALTGEETFTASRKYAPEFSFSPKAKLVLTVNGLPPTDDASRGFWRRPAVINFPRTYNPEDDPGLKDRLWAELPGILAWAVRGCLAWQQRKLRPFPASLVANVEEWRQEEDLLGGFIQDCCERVGDESATVPKAQLLAVYLKWAESSGEETVKISGRGAEWGKLLKQRGIKSHTAGRTSVWKGIDLRPEWKSDEAGSIGLESSFDGMLQ